MNGRQGKKRMTPMGTVLKCIDPFVLGLTPSRGGPHRIPGAWRNILADRVPTKKKKEKKITWQPSEKVD